MKKSIFAVVILVTACLFSACKPDDKKDAVTGITVNPSELTLYPGDESRLSITVTPEKATYNSDDLVWESSDTSVVVVSKNGTVTALAEGTANVTVTYKELKSACAITVSSWIKNLTFTGVFFGVNDTAIYGDQLDTIQDLSGTDYYVKKVQAIVELYTAGFFISNEGQLAGASEGGIFTGYAPMYYAPGWANHSDRGTYFCLGEWYILDTLISQCIVPGSINDLYLENMKGFLNAINEGDESTAYTQYMAAAGEEGCEGMTLIVYNYHTTAEGYPEDGYYSSYIPDLFGIKGYFEAEDNYLGSNYLCSIEGHHIVAKSLLFDWEDGSNAGYSFGCHWRYDETAQAYTWVDETIKFDEPYTYDYNLDIFQSAPSRVRGEKQYKIVPKVSSIEETKLHKAALRSIPSDKKLAK